MAVANYHDTYGSFPPAYLADENGVPIHSWRVLLLPFLDGSELYGQYDFGEPWDGPNNRKLIANMPTVFGFHSRSDLADGTTNYLAVVGEQTVWPSTGAMGYEHVGDGTGTTILIVENEGAGIFWTEPRDLDFDTMVFDLKAESAASISSIYAPPAILTVDSQVLKLDLEHSPASVRALLTANGGEHVNSASLHLIEDGRERPLKE